MKNQNGFTLVEMMIVLMIISILLLITIPNVTKNNSSVKKKGCDALVQLVGAQVQAYEIEKGSTPPDLETLITEKYIKTYTCPGGGQVQLAADGSVTAPAAPAGT
ncbi:competence type IV pilus major pilin ComGC [Schinkia azotoformans]|uniref:ComG operon protein 3 n=1 Tax=Schinkia azotoformans LMG 9581 TaxID=1131731 RepID=K6DT99_SCHAZ|nr:competence type IV pilus major pilin ComGC [Schinkia azotoformans]EKN63986.1 ComG operon protein 3 [Schinkia azotoformans LMG 9581]MEC1640579.1 competence type IV pilus major pilin ComGC [Schinkia azotoformans]MEC1719406.1 competence type IV pilus major pilin ComGC [Schinkia azotoformans]MEC1944536.1 competence type IV pilus major pilin ComGC [Schinkia azotoformans]MED4353452.1 competence type IV pilus major pilin ComGC [Schinkia azotoformans]